MNNRRSFLKMLGLSAIAVPAVASLTAEVEAAPVSAVAINAKYRLDAENRYGLARDLIEAQREINRRRSAVLAIVERSNDYRLIA